MSGRWQARTRLAAARREPPGARDSVGQDCCVRRALEAAKAALARDAAAVPNLSDLAEAAGVSPRTLQRRFAQVLGLAPHAVIQRLRLGAARQTLRSGEAPSVLGAALRHGFEHPGRFAIAYARAFEEAPSATLRAARRRGRSARAATPSSGTLVVLRALVPATPADAARARRATDDLAIALRRAHGLVLLSPEPGAFRQPHAALRLEGRVEADCAVLSVVQPASGVVLRTIREPFGRRAGLAWADRAVGAVRAAAAAEQAERARRTPRHRADVEALVARARPAALSQEPGMVGVALDLLGEALHRDPAHPRALALAAWGRALGANHCFTRDPDGERDGALAHSRRALALAPDDPEVLTLAAGALSLTRRLDEAEGLSRRGIRRGGRLRTAARARLSARPAGGQRPTRPALHDRHGGHELGQALSAPGAP
jgi:AraC-like DNA-binding protein